MEAIKKLKPEKNTEKKNEKMNTNEHKMNTNEHKNEKKNEKKNILFLCDHCDKTFKTKASMRRHQNHYCKNNIPKNFGINCNFHTTI